MPERPPLDCAVLSHKGMVRTHNEDAVFVDARGRHRGARRRHGRLQRRRGRERHRGRRRQQRHAAGAQIRPRAVEGGHRERPHACGAAAAAEDRRGEQGDLRGGAGAPRVRRHGDDARRPRVLRQPGQHRPHRRLALLPAARRQVRAADARPLAAAGTDRRRHADAGAGPILAQQEPRHPRPRHRGHRAGGHRRVPGRGRRHLSAQFRRPDRHGRARRRPVDHREEAARTWLRRRRSWSIWPTRTAGATTSPSCWSGCRRRSCRAPRGRSATSRRSGRASPGHGQARPLPCRRQGGRDQARSAADHDRAPSGQRHLPRPIPP